MTLQFGGTVERKEVKAEPEKIDFSKVKIEPLFEELVGKTLIAITNLPSRAMMGMDSCVMLLSAIHEEEGEEKLHFLKNG